MRGLIEFDLAPFANLEIHKATLTLSVDPTQAPSVRSLAGSNQAVLRRVTAAWSEATVNWQNQPVATVDDQILFGPASGSTFTIDLNVTKLVTIMARPGMNHGFMLQLTTETPERSMRFASSDHPTASLRPRLTIDYGPRCGDSATLFTDVAYVGAPACSDSDYSRVDNCYNVCNPPYPSLQRSTSLFAVNNGGGVVPFEEATYSQPDADVGATAVLPFARSTNDGRVVIQGGCRGCVASHLQVFRPETLGHDGRLKTTTPPVPRGYRGVIHPLTYYNPITSRLPGVTSQGRYPDANQSTICDVSGAAVADTLADAVSGRLSASGRNPAACRAHQFPVDDGNPAAELAGDCYDVTLMYGLASDGVWEMRTVDVTLFVRDPKQVATLAEDGQSIWVYPRNPTGEERTASSWRLPAYQPFDIWKATQGINLGAQVDWDTVFTTRAQYNCYSQVSPTPVRNRNGPKWCEFLDRQRQGNSFNVDNNRNATLGDGVQWNGSACGVTQSGAPGSCQALALFEPTTSADGRLAVVNMAGLYYSYNTLGACRADGWTKFLPISSMPADPNVYNNYPIGRTQRINGVSRPFRDPLGNEIPFGTLNHGAYAWLDRQAKNLFFAEANYPRDGYFGRAAITPTGNVVTATQYPPPDGERVRMNPDREPGLRHTVVGAWTQGKMITLDNGLNASDISGAGSSNPADPGRLRWDLRLYSGLDYRFYPRATTAISSFENQFNYLDAFRPTLPFDVVWTMQGNNQRNAEVAFDEYLRNDAFIIAHMNAPSTMSSGPSFVKDGFTATNPSALVRYGDIADFRFRETPLLQNAATSTPSYSSSAVRPPSYLRVRGGARVEPLALGGVLGKGLYLDGQNDFLDVGYPIDASRSQWYLGLWLDSHDRSAGSLPRTVFFFSDGSWIGLEQSDDSNGARTFSLVAYNGPSRTLRKLAIGSVVRNDEYFHLGVKVGFGARSRVLNFFINGTPVGSLSFALADVNSDPAFGKPGFNVMHDSMNNGWTWMAIGDPGPAFVPGQLRSSFKGWIDELRVYALDDENIESEWMNEFICNTALGTLVDIAERAGETITPALSALRTRASSYPAPPTAICEQLKLETSSSPLDFPHQYGRSLCIDRVHKNPRSDPSLAARCLRATKLEVSGRALAAEAPRPDSSTVPFCLSCHHSEAKIAGLLPAALGPSSLSRWWDPRRQPLDRPAVLSGSAPSWLTATQVLGDATRTLDHQFDPGLAQP